MIERLRGIAQPLTMKRTILFFLSAVILGLLCVAAFYDGWTKQKAHGVPPPFDPTLVSSRRVDQLSAEPNEASSPTIEISKIVAETSDGTAEGEWMTLEELDTTLNARWNIRCEIVGKLSSRSGIDKAVVFVTERAGPGSLRAELIAVAFAYAPDDPNVLLDALDRLNLSADKKVAGQALWTDHQIPIEIFENRKTLTPEGLKAYAGNVVLSVLQSENPSNDFQSALRNWRMGSDDDLKGLEPGKIALDNFLNEHPGLRKDLSIKLGEDFLDK